MNETRKVFFKFAVPIMLVIQVLGLVFLESTNMDSHEYIALSHSLRTGEYSAPPGLAGFSGFAGEDPTRMRQPLYPLFLFVFYQMLGERILVVQLIQVSMNLLTIWILAVTAHRLLRKRLKPYSILFAAMYFPWLVFSSRLLTETLYSLLLWISILFLAKCADTNGRRHCLAFGMIAGAMVLLRPEGILVWAVSLVPMLIIIPGRKAFLNWLISGIGVLICILPWAIRNQVEFGELSPYSSTSGYNLWVSSRPIGSECWDGSEEFQRATDYGRHYYIDSAASREFADIAISNFRRDGVFVIAGRALQRTALAWMRFPGTGELVGWNMKFVLLTVANLSMLGLAVAGFISLKTRRAWLLVFPVVVFSLSLPLTKGLTRYLLPGMPAVALLAGQGLLSLFGKKGGSKPPDSQTAAGPAANYD